MWWRSMLFWLVLAAFAIGVYVALMRVVPPELGSRFAASLLLVSALLVGLSSWREHGWRSREGRRTTIYVVGMAIFAVSAFLAAGILKSVLLGISGIIVVGVVVDQWRSRRAAA